MSFPSAIPTYNGFTPSHTLAADTHGEQHNQEQADIIALATKVGTGSSTPNSTSVLVGNGTGTSTWGQVNLATQTSGILQVANGGSGSGSSTGSGSNVLSNSPTLVSPTESNGTYTSPTISNPTISGYANNSIPAAAIANNSLTNNQLATNSILPSNLDSVASSSSWAWQSFTPTINLNGGSASMGNGVNTGGYIQIGKTVHYWINHVIGSTTTYSGMTSINFALPVAASANYAGSGIGGQQGYGQGMASGSGVTYELSTQIQSATNALLVCKLVNASYVYYANISQNVPIAWTTGNGWGITGTYEAAS